MPGSVSFLVFGRFWESGGNEPRLLSRFQRHIAEFVSFGDGRGAGVKSEVAPATKLLTPSRSLRNPLVTGLSRA